MSIFSIYLRTIQESFESGHQKLTESVTEIYACCDNAMFTSNERNMAFRMPVAEISVNRLYLCFVYLVLLFITS